MLLLLLMRATPQVLCGLPLRGVLVAADLVLARLGRGRLPLLRRFAGVAGVGAADAAGVHAAAVTTHTSGAHKRDGRSYGSTGSNSCGGC
jgi:hypothetical protein